MIKIDWAADGDRRTISNYIEYATMNYIFNNNIVDDIEMNETMIFEKNELNSIHKHFS